MSEKLIKKLFLPSESKKYSLQVDEIHKEGDVWEENGKTWTITDGIKTNKNPMSSFRTTIHVPNVCPVCNNAMIKRLDPKYFKLFGMCLDCKSEEDTKRIINGTFDEYEKNFIKSNKEQYIADMTEYIQNYISGVDAQHVVNEFGDIEEWKQGMSKDELKLLFDEKLSELKST